MAISRDPMVVWLPDWVPVWLRVSIARLDRKYAGCPERRPGFPARGLHRCSAANLPGASLANGFRMAGDDRKLYVETIIDVIDHYGYAQVAERVNVRTDDLDRWMSGERRPPLDVFLRIIDLKAGAKK